MDSIPEKKKHTFTNYNIFFDDKKKKDLINLKCSQLKINDFSSRSPKSSDPGNINSPSPSPTRDNSV